MINKFVRNNHLFQARIFYLFIFFFVRNIEKSARILNICRILEKYENVVFAVR